MSTANKRHSIDTLRRIASAADKWGLIQAPLLSALQRVCNHILEEKYLSSKLLKTFVENKEALDACRRGHEKLLYEQLEQLFCFIRELEGIVNELNECHDIFCEIWKQRNDAILEDTKEDAFIYNFELAHFLKEVPKAYNNEIQLRKHLLLLLPTIPPSKADELERILLVYKEQPYLYPINKNGWITSMVTSIKTQAASNKYL